MTAYAFLRRLSENFVAAAQEAFENAEPEEAAALFTLATRYCLLVGAYREPSIRVVLPRQNGM